MLLARRAQGDGTMENAREFTPAITIADQPTEADLTRLSRDGYRGVVNLRHDGEPEQPLDTAEEGRCATELGMKYLHYGVGGAPLTAEGVAGVIDFINDQTADGGKVLVHCRRGGRAAALVFLQQAERNGWGPEDVRTQAAALGLPLEGKLLGMVEDYLRSQSRSA